MIGVISRLFDASKPLLEKFMKVTLYVRIQYSCYMFEKNYFTRA